MAKEIKLPQISEDADSARVAEILVAEGDTIEKEQSIIAVETDKASVEVPAPEGGTVQAIKVAEGDEITVGDVILTLEENGNGKEEQEEEEEKKKKEKQNKEEKEEKPAAGEKKQKKDEKEEKKEPAGEEREKDEKEEQETEEEKGKTDRKKEEVPASPAVRRRARELEVDITQVEGSGPEGRILEEDVEAAAEGAKEEAEEKAAPEKKTPARETLSLPDFSRWGEVERRPLSGIRLATARNTAASWRAVPHVTQFDEADISGIQAYIEKNQDRVAEAGGKLTITAVLLKLAAGALQQHPKFNASIDLENEEVVLKKYIHIGVAVDTEKGLLVPIIRDADQKSIEAIAVELTELSERARQGDLSPDEMKGGNFVVSNLGGIGGTNFTPIVYHPHVAILGVARASMQPVFENGEFEPRPILPLSLSYDHRLIDGAEGARFLRWICNAIEDPYKALLEA